MFISIILGIILSIIWCIFISPWMMIVFMAFGMASGAPGLTNKEHFVLSFTALLIAAIAYIGVPVLLFFLIL